eukprot:5773350-Amphidinium_carterae.1
MALCRLVGLGLRTFVRLNSTKKQKPCCLGGVVGKASFDGACKARGRVVAERDVVMPMWEALWQWRRPNPCQLMACRRAKGR